jgi:hypothetical protein
MHQSDVPPPPPTAKARGLFDLLWEEKTVRYDPEFLGVLAEKELRCYFGLKNFPK